MWWADLVEQTGAAPSYRRPVVVVQCDSYNLSRIATVVCVIVTSQLKWADAPGNIILSSRSSGLDRDSVANVSQIVTLDRAALTERVGRLTDRKLGQILDGVGGVIGR